MDLDRAVPALVQGRTMNGADDVAALLHGRLTKRLELAGSRNDSNRIVGLFSAAAGVTDPDLVQALEDRRTFIEQRARSLALEAIENRQPWAMRLGQPPADQDRRAEWLRQLETIAAYRDRWQIKTGAMLGDEPRSTEQMAHQDVVHHAVSAALALGHTTNSARDVSGPVIVIEPDVP